MTMKERLAALPVIGTAMAVQQRTKADAADQFGAAIAFHGFISLFPLVAVAVAITGWLLADQPERVAEVVNAIQSAVPGLETAAVDNVLANVIDNAGSIGLIGFLGALYTGLRITNAAQTATQFVFGVNLQEVSAVKARTQQLGSLLALGVLTIAGVAASAWVQRTILSELSGPLGAVLPSSGLLLSAALDTLLFWTAYRLFSLDAGVASKALVPGALLGGIGWSALKYFGGSYLTSQTEGSVVAGDGASAAGLLLATMIGLLLLFYIAGRLYVYGAELSAELAGFGVRAAVEDEHQSEPEEDDEDVDEAPVEHASGDRQGLLAALEAHEQRRGVTPPTPPSDADADTGDDGGDVAETGPDDGGEVPAHAASPGDAGGTGATGDTAGDDLVVTIGHRPEADQHDAGSDDVHQASAASAAVSPDDEDAERTAHEAHATWAQRPAPMTRELVPFSPPDIATSVAQDPAVRRIAIAAAVGLVGIAAGVLRRRRG